MGRPAGRQGHSAGALDLALEGRLEGAASSPHDDAGRGWEPGARQERRGLAPDRREEARLAEEGGLIATAEALEGHALEAG